MRPSVVERTVVIRARLESIGIVCPGTGPHQSLVGPTLPRTKLPLFALLGESDLKIEHESLDV